MRLKLAATDRLIVWYVPKIRRSIGFFRHYPRDNISLLKVHTELHDIYAERWITCKQWRISGHHSPNRQLILQAIGSKVELLALTEVEYIVYWFTELPLICEERYKEILKRSEAPWLTPLSAISHARRAPEKPCLLPQRATLCVQQIHWNEMPGIGIHIDMLLSATPNQYILHPSALIRKASNISSCRTTTRWRMWSLPTSVDIPPPFRRLFKICMGSVWMDSGQETWRNSERPAIRKQRISVISAAMALIPYLTLPFCKRLFRRHAPRPEKTFSKRRKRFPLSARARQKPGGRVNLYLSVNFAFCRITELFL